MSTIRCIYSADPAFPATDQHPDAVRYVLTHPMRGRLVVDALGGQPTLQEIDLVFSPPPPSATDLENDCLAALNGGAARIDVQKLMKAKVVSDLAFRLGVAPGALTVAQILAERTRLATIYKAL